MALTAAQQASLDAAKARSAAAREALAASQAARGREDLAAKTQGTETYTPPKTSSSSSSTYVKADPVSYDASKYNLDSFSGADWNNPDTLKEAAASLSKQGMSNDQIAQYAKDSGIAYSSMDQAFGKDYQGLLDTTYGVGTGSQQGIDTGSTSQGRSGVYTRGTKDTQINLNDYIPQSGLSITELKASADRSIANMTSSQLEGIASRLKDAGYTDDAVGAYLRSAGVSTSQIADMNTTNLDADLAWKGYNTYGSSYDTNKNQFIGEHTQYNIIDAQGNAVSNPFAGGASPTTTGRELIGSDITYGEDTPAVDFSNVVGTQPLGPDQIAAGDWMGQVDWTNPTGADLQRAAEFLTTQGYTPDQIAQMAADAGVPIESMLAQFGKDYASNVLGSYGYTTLTETTTPAYNVQTPLYDLIAKLANQERSNVTEQTVTPGMTVAGQLQGLLDPNSELMKQAATQGMQYANSRGLLNSSIGAQAAQAAMYDKAFEIASADALANQRVSEFNASAQNTDSMFNATQYNSMQQYNATAINNMAQFNEELANKVLVAQMGIDASLKELQVSQAGLDRRLQAELDANKIVNNEELASADRELFSRYYGQFTDTYNTELMDIQLDPDMSEADKTAAAEYRTQIWSNNIDFYSSLFDIPMNLEW